MGPQATIEQEPQDDQEQESATAAADQGDNTTPDDAEPEGAEQLGDPGKKALDVMKADRNAARAENRTLREQLEQLQAKIDGREKEHAEQKRLEGEALSKANDRIRRAEIRAAAAGKLADPADALAYLDLSKFEVGDDGEIDTEQVASAIADLLTRKPYLAANTGPQFPANDGNATRKGAQGPSQLSEQDVKRLYAAKDYDAIEKARQEGRLNDVLGIKPT